jgi:predicted ATP-dependent Lon-type protease
LLAFVPNPLRRSVGDPHTNSSKTSLKLSLRAVGNFEVDVQHQQRVGHLFGSLPPEMRNDTAFMDRIHAYLLGGICLRLIASCLRTVLDL